MLRDLHATEPQEALKILSTLSGDGKNFDEEKALRLLTNSFEALSVADGEFDEFGYSDTEYTGSDGYPSDDLEDDHW